MAKFAKPALFRQAMRDIREAARRGFRQTQFGRMAAEAERLARGGPITGGTLRRYARFSPEGAMRELMRTDIGRLARQVQRYAKGSERRLVFDLLDQLGPAGRIIRTLIQPTRGGAGMNRELAAAIELVRAFGGETLLPHGGQRQTTGAVARGIDAARQYLETLGYEVVSPEEQEARGLGRKQLPTPQEPAPRPARRSTQRPIPPRPAAPSGHVEVPLEHRTQSFPANHPIVTGDMVAPGTSLGGGHRSSNVHSFGYDIDNQYLYVRFYADSESEAPGPLYRYFDVKPRQFLSLLAAGSKGGWVWDHLRVRGTVSGHQKDYQLVGITRGYVPRKATLQRAGEAFVPRTVHLGQGRFQTSSRPYERTGLVRRGTPNNGRPKPPNNG